MNTHLACFTLALGAAVLSGCSSTIKIDPASIVGQRFPTIIGEGLDQKKRMLPDDLAGKPAILFVGYKQSSQFDIDRWMLGLMQTQTPVTMYEIPTISGMLPGLYANQIDEGMRQGIPKELWSNVITVYGDADKIEAFTGNENPMPARVLLLDQSGTVVWFHDRGFSPTLLRDLDTKARSLPSSPSR